MYYSKRDDTKFNEVNMENNDKVINIINKNVDKIEDFIDLKIDLWRVHDVFSGL